MFGLKKGKKRKHIKNIELSWHEGKFFDYWFFVHGLTGVTFGLVAHLFNLNFELAVVSTVIIMIIFEISENIFGNTISEIEHPINSLVDILEGVLVFYVVFKLAEGTSESILIISIIVSLLAVLYLRKKAHTFIRRKRWWRLN